MQILEHVTLPRNKPRSRRMRFEPFSPKKLKQLRKEKRLTQKRLAAIAKISEVTLKKIEADKYQPSLKTLGALGRALDLYLYAEWEKEEAPDDTSGA